MLEGWITETEDVVDVIFSHAGTTAWNKFSTIIRQMKEVLGDKKENDTKKIPKIGHGYLVKLGSDNVIYHARYAGEEKWTTLSDEPRKGVTAWATLCDYPESFAEWNQVTEQKEGK